MRVKVRRDIKFQGYAASGSLEISAPGAFTAVGFSGLRRKPGASAAERGKLTLFKTIDENERERHDLRFAHLPGYRPKLSLWRFRIPPDSDIRRATIVAPRPWRGAPKPQDPA